MTPPTPFALLAVVTAIGTAPAIGQQIAVDRGTLDIRVSGTLVGREEFAIQRGRAGAGTGFTITSSVVYPADRPTRRLVSVVELDTDSLAAASQFEVSDGDVLRVLMRFGPRRVTVRTLSSTGESAREYPSNAQAIIVDDSAFAALALLPQAVTTARGFPLRGGAGTDVSISDRGAGTVTVHGDRRPAHHITLSVGSQSREIWYGEHGKLLKVEIPDRHLVAERVPESAN